VWNAKIRKHLWFIGQSSCLQIQRSGFDSRSYQIFWVVVGLVRGPLSLVSTLEELFETKSSDSGLGSREYGHRNPSRWPRGTLYPQKLALTSPTRGVCSVVIVLSRTQAMEYFYYLLFFSFPTSPSIYPTNLLSDIQSTYWSWNERLSSIVKQNNA
jgi:hypothetical protein